MKFRQIRRCFLAAGSVLAATSASAATTVSTFDDFVSGALYGSWSSPSTVVVSGPTSYDITATGYGSNWKYTPVNGTGSTNVELTVTVSGPAAADGHLGPIVSLVDADGTYANYAWYGRPLGRHVLTMPVATPTSYTSQGTKPGLDVATIEHLHLQLDPGGFGTQGAYTVSWEHLRLTGGPMPRITDYSFNTNSREFTITWTSEPDKLYSVFYAESVTGPWTPAALSVYSAGTNTSATISMPEGNSGFLRVEDQ